MELLDWGRAVFALLATLALIGLLALAARRLGMTPVMNPMGARRLRVTERLMLDPRRQLVLVALDGQEHLLLLSPFGDRPIAHQPASPALQDAAPAAPISEATP